MSEKSETVGRQGELVGQNNLLSQVIQFHWQVFSYIPAVSIINTTKKTTDQGDIQYHRFNIGVLLLFEIIYCLTPTIGGLPIKTDAIRLH